MKKQLQTEWIKWINDKHNKYNNIKEIERKKSNFTNIYKCFIILSIPVVMFLCCENNSSMEKQNELELSTCATDIAQVSIEPMTTYMLKQQKETETTTSIESQNDLNVLTLDYFAKCVMAEAGNQDETGKRLVVDVILNRLDDNRFPDTIEEIINQAGQFEVVESGRINSVIPTEDIYNIISQELENRFNSEVLYFRTEHYHKFATPLFQHQDHYFSK